MRRCLAIACLLLSVSLTAAELSKTSMLREYKSADAKYAKADAVLNRVRFATANLKRAKGYIRDLEAVIQRYPRYEYKAEAYYFLGVNRKFAHDYTGAVEAFSHALNLKPELAQRAPIDAFIKTSRFEHRAIMIPRFAWGALAIVAVLGVFLAVKGRAWEHVNRRSMVFAAGCFLVWLIAFFVLSAINTTSQVTGLESYPKPVLVNTTLGTIGDAPFRGILGFGSAAVALSILFSLASSQVSSRAKRHAVNIAASLVASIALMTLCYMRFCYRTAGHIEGTAGGRMNIQIKDIVRREDIPDEMLKLYDEEFRNKVLEDRKK